MAKRSLQASLAGVQQAKRAFALKGWTQDNLAGEVNLKTRQPIWRFLTGKSVDRQVFMEICLILNLDWQEISEASASPEPVAATDLDTKAAAAAQALNDWVKQLRLQHHETIQNQCGILQLLDISRPVSIDDIYVDVNILEELTSAQWVEIADLKDLGPDEFDRVGLGSLEQPQIPGMQAVETYSKLRVLGRPGVGKTTFLQNLAIQCDRGQFAAEQVPIFILLREFAEESRKESEFSLFKHIQQALHLLAAELESLLEVGRVLLLMDGMDELRGPDMPAVLKEIRRFSEKYHRNRFVASCRTATQKLRLRGFTDVEIAPFNTAQITTFAQKWFVALTQSTPRWSTTGQRPSGLARSAMFMEKLDLPENWQFRQLVVTPLFLHLACWVFQGQAKFPTKRTEFYKQGLDLLLGKWDEAKGVERDEVYREFLLPQKLRLLSQLAAVTFEQGQYFFEQRIIEAYIEDYLRELPDASLEPEELQLESEAILKAIEAQHGLLIERARGIFSFSYLAFQEYFTARKIVANHNLQALEQALGGLVSHITDPHWHEIFLLTAAMLRSADSLVQLMKQQIDGLVAQDPELQSFLVWASQKSQSLPPGPKLATTRAFYLALAQNSQTVENFTLASSLDQGILLDQELNHLLIEFAIDHSQDFAYVATCRAALNRVLVQVLDAGFQQSLQQLQAQLPPPKQTAKRQQDWWRANYGAWVENLRRAIIHYRNIHHPWQFSPEQQLVLQRYYAANQLLVDCLNSNCEVTAAIRQDIEATLLLPQQELDDREWQGK
jgi:predicted NACHT family NTPase